MSASSTFTEQPPNVSAAAITTDLANACLFIEAPQANGRRVQAKRSLLSALELCGENAPLSAKITREEKANDGPGQMQTGGPVECNFAKMMYRWPCSIQQKGSDVLVAR
ncbi:hypothetical protein [Pseudomonas veronii]|uniref:Uncharacterized protein n=1 Tax=Pseudomonas veronii TaxID=76761 RepID=A0A4P7Y347_PSEVE|nr:hypothetical protein [Pseudomonas veronii]NMY12679.1 hypothetical protein [Pseudomonas veronii]QCG65337.2 hypothetical protein E4167_08380 [Pseudomonas veronii]